MAQIELLQPTEKIKDSYGKINTSLTNLNNNKLEKSGGVVNGLVEFANGKIQIGSSDGIKRYLRFDGAISEDDQTYHTLWHSGNNLVSFNPGYVKLANGFLLQFGVVIDVPSLTPTPVTFGIAFPTYIVGVWPSPHHTAPTKVSFFNLSLSGAVVIHDDPNTISLTYLAVGW